jgi:hypothetical protein
MNRCESDGLIVLATGDDEDLFLGPLVMVLLVVVDEKGKIVMRNL